MDLRWCGWWWVYVGVVWVVGVGLDAWGKDKGEGLN